MQPRAQPGTPGDGAGTPGWHGGAVIGILAHGCGVGGAAPGSVRTGRGETPPRGWLAPPACVATAIRSEIAADMQFIIAAAHGNRRTNALAPRGARGSGGAGTGGAGSEGGTERMGAPRPRAPISLGSQRISGLNLGSPRRKGPGWAPPGAPRLGAVGSVAARAGGAVGCQRAARPRCSGEPTAATCDMCQRVNDCSIQGESQNIQGQTLPCERHHEY